MAAGASRGGCESVTKFPHNSYPLQFPSYTGRTGSTSDLHGVHLHGIVVFGNRVYHHVSRIWYGASLTLRLGDTHSDRHTDFLAFSVIIYLVVRSNINRVPIPRLLRIIVRDATCYFLFIFTSHLLVVLFLWFASVRVSSPSPAAARSDLCRTESSYSLPRK